jgi:hypothetical protein
MLELVSQIFKTESLWEEDEKKTLDGVTRNRNIKKSVISQHKVAVGVKCSHLLRNLGVN